ncbi:protein kilB [Kitasatospora sp. NPDC059646]|uniref:protein kilB n=1 Tax=Kitasatospora sp. NPDC059646 TaxID=3346893 RepID=UPI00369E56F8
MVPTLLAVCGTLLGTLGAVVLQQRAARAERAEARRDAHEQARLRAVAELVTALDNHRRAMWLREKLRLSGAGDDAFTEARTASHLTRAAITGPLVTLSVLAPTLAKAANDAVRATYALREAPDLEVLQQARSAAIAATESLVAAAGDQFA